MNEEDEERSEFENENLDTNDDENTTFFFNEEEEGNPDINS